jgi:aspartate/methionine/tyrosine aminotransferase
MKFESLSRTMSNNSQDPVIIINGLTKIFRLPGFRICWIVGPKVMVRACQLS